MEDQELLNKLKKKLTKCKQSVAFLNVLTTSQGQMRIPSCKLRPQKREQFPLSLYKSSFTGMDPEAKNLHAQPLQLFNGHLHTCDFPGQYKSAQQSGKVCSKY